MDAEVLVLIYDFVSCQGNPGDYLWVKCESLLIVYPNIHIYICVVIKIV